MNRPRIDRAIRMQLARMECLLREVRQCGGKAEWSHLFTHGHRFPTVLAAVRQGYLARDGNRVELTAMGSEDLAQLEYAMISGISE